jgi:hypothetical protein
MEFGIAQKNRNMKNDLDRMGFKPLTLRLAQLNERYHWGSLA